MSKFDVPQVVHDILEEFKSPHSTEEIDVATRIRLFKTHSHEMERFFATLAKRARSATAKASKSSLPGKWVRCISYDYSTMPLSYVGSLKSSSRFVHGSGQPTIYLAEDPDTATKEVRFSHHFRATTCFGIEYNLRFVLDLTDTKNLYKNFRISRDYFRMPWEMFNNIGIKYYTQYLSDFLRTLPIEGFVYESVQNPGKKCICIFADKLLQGSSLKVIGTYAGFESCNLELVGSI